MNVIIDDDLWQVVKAKKLQEGNFEVWSSMSFGSSHWCRSTPREEHRPMESDENRPTHPVKHQLTPSIDSVGSCETVRIMTHLIHPSPTVWPQTKSISTNNQSPIDRRSHATIDMSSPAVIHTRLSPTECGYLASMWPDWMHSDTHLNLQRHQQTSTTSNLRM